jgi:hypothetical protein
MFDTYCKLLVILVEKVDERTTVGVDQHLLLDYIFAGLNCRAFGERQRALIKMLGGRWAVPIPMQAIHAKWPFDIISKKPGITDEEYCQVSYLPYSEFADLLGLSRPHRSWCSITARFRAYAAILLSLQRQTSPRRTTNRKHPLRIRQSRSRIELRVRYRSRDGIDD